MLIADSISRQFKTTSGTVQALDKVSLSLDAGECVGLLGHSGSGKSTAAKVLALLLKPDAGKVRIDGQAVERWGIDTPRELRRKVQLLWQSPRLAVDSRLRLKDIVVEPLIANRQVPSREERTHILAEWSTRVGLTDDLLTRFPHEVSDGQLQRACLARSLILEPDYLICDEISSMLDVSTQASLIEVIKQEQQRRGLGVILITHDQVLAKYTCNRIIEIENGRIKTPA